MANELRLAVQVVYAEPALVWQKTLDLSPGATVAQALLASRFAMENPNYPYDALRVGIFGQERALDHALENGDRIEIYRPLTFDPMESRRRRAIHRKAFMTKSKNRPKRRKARQLLEKGADIQ